MNYDATAIITIADIKRIKCCVVSFLLSSIQNLPLTYRVGG